MDLSTLTGRAGIGKNRKRVGRGPGSGTGKTSGRGHKGQKARSGYSHRAGNEGGQMPLYRRLPKRGFNHQKRFPFAVVNLDVLEKHFEEGTEVTADALVQLGIIDGLMKGGLKVLARGEITKKLKFKVNAVSAEARTKIEAAGGTIEIVDLAQVKHEASGKAKE